MDAAATSISITLSSVLKMTEILERTEEEEDWKNEDLDESPTAVRELRKLKDTKNSMARVLRNKALPTAAFSIKFLAKIFGDITLSKSFSYNSSFTERVIEPHRWHNPV